MRSIIICVDDEKWLLDVLSGLLADWLGKNYQVEKALSGLEALDIIDSCLAEDTDVSLVISDYIMPEMKGDALLEQVKLKTPLTRRIMLTGFAAIEGITNAINKAGIYRFLSKPWDNKDLMLTVLQAIHSYEQDKQNEKLLVGYKELVHKSQSMVVNMQTQLQQYIGVLSAATEVREGGSQGHSERVARYALRIAAELKIPGADAKNLETAALLHDVGKLGLKDKELVALHGAHCYQHMDIALKQAEQAKIILKQMSAEILPGIIYHTECADGSGPYGLKSETIPLPAKIIGLCNYFDILCVAHPGDALLKVLGSMAPYTGNIIDKPLFDTLMKIL